MQSNKNNEPQHNPELPTQPPIHNVEIKQEILDIFGQLHREIDILDKKVEILIEQHEGEFVLAYQNHVKKIKMDLEALKSKSDAQDKQLKNNNRVMFLEKQATLFRDESLKLYERLEVKTQQAQYYKFRTKDLEKTNLIMQKEVRETLKNKKLIEAKLLSTEADLMESNRQLQQKDNQIKSLTETLSTNYQPPNMKNSEYGPPYLYSRLKQTTRQSAVSKVEKTTNGSERKRSMSFIANSKDSELKQWFEQCVRTIKKEVASRKGSGFQVNLDNIRDIKQFMMIDKLRLLEKLMENESLLILMYQKLFPSRNNQLKEYLSQRQVSISQQKQETLPDSNLSAYNLINIDKSTQGREPSESNQKIQVSLPKMRTSHHHSFSHSNNHRSNQIANRVSFKQGKLRIINP